MTMRFNFNLATGACGECQKEPSVLREHVHEDTVVGMRTDRCGAWHRTTGYIVLSRADADLKMCKARYSPYY